MNRVSSSDETYGRSIRGHIRESGHTHNHQYKVRRQRSHSPSSLGRSSPGSVDSHEASKTRMRWILSLGLLLPALAAIIGVVAWAVSAEVVMGTRREMARNNELNKPSEANYWLNHNRNKHSQEHVVNDRVDEPSAEKMQQPIRTKPSVIKDMRKEYKNESSNTNKENSLTRNANIYFLAGLDSLSSSKMVNSETTNGKQKKSTGAQVAEVIDRIVAQRKSVGSPHIVVVAPLSDSKKKSTSTTTTSTTAAPKTYSRDADTLLAAAQLLAAQHKIKALNRMDNDDDHDQDDYDDSNSDTNNNKNRNKPNFESANLLNYDNQKQGSENNYVSVPPPYQSLPQPVPPPQPPPHNPQPHQPPYVSQTHSQPTFMSSNRIGFENTAHQHLPQPMHQQHNPPMGSPTHYRGAPHNQPLPPPMSTHNMPPPYPMGPIPHGFSNQAFNGGFNNAAASYNSPSFSSVPFNGPPPNSFNKNNRALVSFQGGDMGDNSYGHGPGGESHGHASYEEGPNKGITLHFGGGPIGGGGQVVTSPIGIFKTLLLPLLPKPRVNLNGKVVFGVVLEKGVGFGKQKQFHPIPHHYKRK